MCVVARQARNPPLPDRQLFQSDRGLDVIPGVEVERVIGSKPNSSRGAFAQNRNVADTAP
jgi:hypothetical protein